MKKFFTFLVIAIVIGLLVYNQRASISMGIMSRALETRMGVDATTALDDGLHVALCGAGGPLAAPTRSGPCVAVIAGEQLFVVDAGTGGVRNLGTMQYPIGKIEAVLLTHFHSDHIDGLGELATLRWVQAANKQPLPVIGPQGVEQVVEGFNKAYALDKTYRYDHHGSTVAPLAGHGMIARRFNAPADGELLTIYEAGDLVIQTLLVDHAPIKPAVAYLFRYKGRSALISGDTVKSANIEKFAQGVDLLVHEALAPQLLKLMNEAAINAGNDIMAKVTHDVLDYHASPIEAAETARDAGVGHLLYYHVVPPLLIPGLEAAWLQGVEEVFPNYTLGEDGTAVSLPAGSREIIKH